MIKKLHLHITFVLLWAFAATAALAENRVALVIGNGSYEVIGQLQNPVNDARLIAETLASVGFDVTSVTDQTESQMGETIDAFVQKARTADAAAIYYAGHGIQHNGENYLMPIDAQIKSEAAIAREGIALNGLTQALANVPISMVFLDACRNNPFADALMSQAQSDGRTAGIKRGLAVVRTPGDMLVTFATLPNTVASDGAQGNSPFAQALAKHIVTPDVEVSVLLKRVTADVMQSTNGEQRPQQLSQMMSEFYFDRGGETKVAAIKPVAQNQAKSLITVYPPRVTVGEEISIVADLSTTCTPSFFNLPPDNKFTPIPLQFLDKTTLDNGQVRYEISPGAEYGLVIQPPDPKGKNNLGYFCTPKGLTDKTASKALKQKITDSIRANNEDGVVSIDGFAPVVYQTRPFIVH